jgi:hypothetical protein
MKKFLFVLSLFVFLFSGSRVLANCKEKGVTCSGEMKSAIKIEKKSQNKFELTTEDAKGFSNSPIRYDAGKQTFVVTTPNGEKETKATPKKAIEIAYITGMMNEFEVKDGLKNVVLIEKDGKVFYEVSGKKTGKIFGLWPVSYDVKAIVDNQGKLASFEKPWILKIVKYVLK